MVLVDNPDVLRLVLISPLDSRRQHCRSACLAREDRLDLLDEPTQLDTLIVAICTTLGRRADDGTHRAVATGLV
jgi:hypothetical protein